MFANKWKRAALSCIAGCLTSSMLHTNLSASIGFITDYNDGNIYSFDPDDTSTPATLILSGFTNPSSIIFSLDGNTVYFSTFSYPMDIYSFPTMGPYEATALGVSMPGPLGIAISPDGSTGYISTDNGEGVPGIYAFPIGGSYPHSSVQLMPSSTTIVTPRAIAMDGNGVAYVADCYAGILYSVTFSDSEYTASAIQSCPYVTSVAVSTDNYLYFDTTQGSIFRVPLNNPSTTPLLVSDSGMSACDGLALSQDGLTLFVTNYHDYVYSLPTNKGFPQLPTALTGIGSGLQPLDVAIYNYRSYVLYDRVRIEPIYNDTYDNATTTLNESGLSSL